jgi:nicotinamidase-related amidase
MSTALLVMDVQQGIVSRYANGGGTSDAQSEARHTGEGDVASGYLLRLRRAIDAARAAGIRVIYVTVAFREGYPEVSARNRSFSRIAGGGRGAGGGGGFIAGSEATAVHPDVAPAPGEPVVVKRRVSAFAGSDLDVLLRAGDVDTLILTGIATSGVVLSTLRQAADLDYRLVVLEDGCLDADPEVHRVLTGKVFPRQAEVMEVAEWVGGLGLKG